MEYERLNNDWNAEPNAPDPKLSINDNSVTLDFYLNYEKFERFNEGDKGQLKFINCHSYSFNSMNDEGYFKGNFRYKDNELPWGDFYLLKSKISDFPEDNVTLLTNQEVSNLKHYIFFFRDNTFECYAENFELYLQV